MYTGTLTARPTPPSRVRVAATIIDSRAHRILAVLAGCLLLAGLLTLRAGSASAATTAENTAARTVFNTINAERSANHLPALAWSTALVSSARRHNVTMAARDTLSHQINPEANPGARISAAGVAWHAYAENIAYTTDRTSAGANHMQQVMYAEKAPNDGHRLNTLSRAVKAVGVDVLIDSRTHKLWLTEDFADVAGKAAAAVAPVNHLPSGHLDSIRVLSGHRVTMAGWAVDPDNRSTPLRIAVYSDGRGVGTFGSGVARADVARAVHAGPRQGFQLTVRLAAGRRTVCSYAINIGPGANRLIKCATVGV
ncbi:MAG TPA: CAP domain-containing protein [Jatrophihabitans sp.]|jgi:uncharacterized protein YkwD